MRASETSGYHGYVMRGPALRARLPVVRKRGGAMSVIGPRLPTWAMQQSRQLIWGTPDVLPT